MRSESQHLLDPLLRAPRRPRSWPDGAPSAVLDDAGRLRPPSVARLRLREPRQCLSEATAVFEARRLQPTSLSSLALARGRLDECPPFRVLVSWRPRLPCAPPPVAHLIKTYQ